MAKAGGSLPRGRRLRSEVGDAPDPSTLTDLEQRAQIALRRLVEEAGGRFDSSTAIPARHLELFASLFQEWAIRHGERSADGVYFDGRPGLRHALDEMYPLQDPIVGTPCVARSLPSWKLRAGNDVDLPAAPASMCPSSRCHEMVTHVSDPGPPRPTCAFDRSWRGTPVLKPWQRLSGGLTGATGRQADREPSARPRTARRTVCAWTRGQCVVNK